MLLGIAAASAYVPYLVVTNTQTVNVQVLVLFLSGLVIAGTILYSLVPRRDRFVPPGLLLEPLDHPKLFEKIHQVAADLNEPVPEEVYLIGAVNARVADRGGILGFGSRRIMAIGLPLFRFSMCPSSVAFSPTNLLTITAGTPNSATSSTERNLPSCALCKIQRGLGPEFRCHGC